MFHDQVFKMDIVQSKIDAKAPPFASNMMGQFAQHSLGENCTVDQNKMRHQYNIYTVTTVQGLLKITL